MNRTLEYLRGVSAIEMDDVAPTWRPLIRAYSAIGGVSLVSSFWLAAKVASFEADGPGVDISPCIHALWHEGALLYMLWLSATGRRVASLMHATPFLRPFEAASILVGWRPVRGSTGRGGREASELLCRELENGWSVMALPDGPYGPPKTLRKGALHMAMQSGKPIVPVSFSVDRSFHLPSWDRKRLPLPGATVRVHCHEPIEVKAKDGAMEEASTRLRDALG